MKAHHIFAVVTAFCIFNMASASEGEIDRERMQQDLDIMEGILQSLHAQTTSNLAGIHREPQIRGLYFENYGVIFHIEEKRSSGMVVDVDVRRLREKPAGVTEELEEEDFLKEVVGAAKKKARWRPGTAGGVPGNVRGWDPPVKGRRPNHDPGPSTTSFPRPDNGPRQTTPGRVVETGLLRDDGQKK